MTLKQLEYLVLLEIETSLQKIANLNNISQSAVSIALKNLEEELTVKLIEREHKNAHPTKIGLSVIHQAKKALREIQKIRDIVSEEINGTKGSLRIGVDSAVAQYIVPDFIHQIQVHYPEVDLEIYEKDSQILLDEVESEDIDLAITGSPVSNQNILEVPLYQESLVLYHSSKEYLESMTGHMRKSQSNQMWILENEKHIEETAIDFCKKNSLKYSVYSSQNMSTIVEIVDKNGGYTILPELHKNFLTDEQLHNIDNEIVSTRTISMYISQNYVREKILNAVADTIIRIIPHNMVNKHLCKFGIKLT